MSDIWIMLIVIFGTLLFLKCFHACCCNPLASGDSATRVPRGRRPNSSNNEIAETRDEDHESGASGDISTVVEAVIDPGK
jgi:hypothetical protein